MILFRTYYLPLIFILLSFLSFSQIFIDNEIKGKVAGLTVLTQSGSPGAPSYIRIRGNGSLIGNNAPLIILDGVPYHNTPIGANPKFPGLDMLALINGSEVYSVTVLKNAIDVASYGVKGSNGVIIITTQRGLKKGPTLEDLLIDMNLLD
tara:strand:+ start:462 stop:911 length:450 start_codon:yes stop_codon:yes gene_type:complete